MSAGRGGPVDLGTGPWRLHLVGLGGSGMNAIATVLLAMGHQVSGSDERRSPVLERLAGMGATVHVGHAAANVQGADLVAFSSAVRADNVELEAARLAGLPVWSRARLLAAVCAQRRCLAVSGTHGKTTTTAMLAEVMGTTGTDLSYLVGGEIPGRPGGARWGSGPWLVVEADESDGTFLELPAHGALVTSVAPDHLDYYGDEEHLRAAFERFLRQVPGPRVLCLDDPGAAGLLAGPVAGAGVTTYGTSADADFRAHDLRLGGTVAGFALTGPGGADLGWFELPVPGLHNVLNATAAVAMGMSAGVGADEARRALAAYRGVRRRFELRGNGDGVTYVDDYAHNPGKVEALLATARGVGPGRVVAVFQPHRYSRTAALWRELGHALTLADVAVVTDVYPAGEVPLDGVTGELVARAASDARPGMEVAYVPGDRAALVGHLRRALRPGDLCLSIGAGDITTLADDMGVAVTGGADEGDRQPAPTAPTEPAAPTEEVER